MKTSLTYGAGMALAGALLVFVLYFLGFHSDVERLPVGQKIQMIGGTVILAGGLIFGIRARRAETPPEEPFGYGRALGAGTLIALFSSLFGAIFSYIYSAFINPAFPELMVRSEVAKLEAQNLAPEAIEGAEKFIRMMSSPAASMVFGFIIGFVMSFIAALIVAAFIRRPASDVPPPIATA